MEQYKGFVADVIYHNEENAYTVFELEIRGEILTCVGTVPAVSCGECCEVLGEFTEHPVYGRQLKVAQFRPCAPEDTQSIYRYLASGAVKGIGEKLAGRIVDRFGEGTLRIMEEEPERLAEIKGISERMSREIGAQMEERRDVRQAVLYLQQFGISNTRAIRIWQTYGMEVYAILKENPYRLADDVDGIGFAAADELAMRLGIRADSDFRIRSAVRFILADSLAEGSTWLPEQELLQKTAQLLGLEGEQILLQIENLILERELVSRFGNEVRQIYLSSAFTEERNIAARLLRLQESVPEGQDEEGAELLIRRLETEERMELDELQRRAVLYAATRSILLISGGPGTGKTTTINLIIRYFSAMRQSVLLAAPTGRAAKRMTEATGHEAVTIHRLLGVRAAAENRSEFSGFEKDESDPLEADAVIIDEMSMTDMHLFSALLRALEPGTRLILVGDRDQLPCVGPGSILKDMIESGVFPVIILKKIFRQAMESDIVMNAHRILEGEALRLDNRSKDFFFLERQEVQPIYKHTVQLIRELLPGYVSCSPQEIQVLTPMRKGNLGVEKLNEALQAVLNPAASFRKEISHHGVTFREGDKVMQTRNNYQITWEIRGNFGLAIERGEGIFNGDCGVIAQIREDMKTVQVLFEDQKTVDFSYEELEDLELAYAITVHKAQGSEYPAVILPLLSGPPSLMNRNLLYTAVTRAKNCVVILGSRSELEKMIRNASPAKRCTGLGDRILELQNLEYGR